MFRPGPGVRERLDELLSAGSDRRSLRDLAQYADDPVRFAIEVLGVQPWSMQRAVLEALRDAALVACAGCNGAGKSLLIGIAALWGVYCLRAKVLLLSASQRQATGVLMRDAVAPLHRAGQLPGDLFVETLRLPDGTVPLEAFTSDSVHRVGGRHAERVLCLVDEAQDPALDELYAGLMGNTTGARDVVGLFGNALRASGVFFSAFRSGTPWRTFRVPASVHPNLNPAGGEPPLVGPGGQPVGPTATWVEKMARVYGAGSAQYLGRVEAQFPTEGADALITRDLVEAAAARWATAPAPNGHASVMAIDPARGHNATACVIRTGTVVREITAFVERDTSRALEAIARIGLRHGITPAWSQNGNPNRAVKARGTLVVDVCGLGGPLADELRRRGFTVLEFNGGTKPNQKPLGAEYQNLRTQAFWELRERFQRGLIALPPGTDCDLLADELTATTWRPTPQGKLAIEDTEGLAQRLQRSPDRADALSMAFATVEAYTFGGVAVPL
jgi:phage terminase large subunit